MINREIKHWRVNIIGILLFLGLSFLVTCKQKQVKTTKGQNYLTDIKFYLQQQIQFDYYWLRLAGQYQSDKYTTALSSLSDDIIKIKNKINSLNKLTVSNKQVNYNSYRNSDIQGLDIDYFVQNFNISDFHHNRTNSGLNNQKDLQKQRIDQLKSATESLYHMRYSQLNIQFQSKYVLSQTIYIRLAYDRKQFALFIDHFKLYLKENLIAFKIAAIDKGSKYSYSINLLSGQKDKQKEQNYDEQKLVQKLNAKAQIICNSLNMKVKSIYSYKQINQSEIDENINQQQEYYDEAASEQTFVNYYEGLQLKQINNEFQYQNIIFQVQALCEAKEKPQYSKVSPKSKLNFKQKKNLIQDIKGGKQLLKQIQKIKKNKHK